MELETNNIIVGAGLISLDVLIWDGQRVPISYYVGGTCGNVMMILSYMGWDAYPIARLDGTKDGARVLDDMKKHRVHTDFVSTQDGKTPVIVQRNFINKDGIPTHKFESRNNIGQFYLDFKSLTLKQANGVIERIDFVPKVFFFDRVSPAILKLATTFKKMRKRTMIAFKIIEAIANCFYVFLLMIFVRCLLTWIPGVNWNNPILNALRSAVDLYLDLFRKIIPPLGMFDLSPIIASFVLIFLRNGIIYAAIYIMAALGMLGN